MTSARPGPMTPRASLDDHVGLALGMTARPGGTVVLAGAGLSVGAGVPAAWEVQRQLLSLAAAASGDNPEDVFVWWQQKTGGPAAYDDVLFATAQTPSVRKDMLKPFFEPTVDERAQGIKIPSDAHRALAQMMRDGLIRIIVTLNFDLMIETALRDLGVEPTIVSTVADVRGMEPLHAQTALVWHLHGDYTNPEMLNTPDELRAYDPIVNARLDELFDQYGLLIGGWSATWDPALREAITRCPSRRYPTTWLNRGALVGEARRLATARGATVVNGTADAWLRRLQEACLAIRDRSKEPISTIAAVAAIKRELALDRSAIAAHDRLQAEIKRIAALPVMNHALLSTMSYAQRIPVLEAELEAMVGFVGALAFWGNTATDPWWTRYIQRYGERPNLGGASDAISSFVAPAVITLFAGGVAAAAAGRWDLVCDLISGHMIGSVYSGVRAPASAQIEAGDMYPGRQWPSRALAEYVGPILSDTVGLGISPTVDGWERFDYILLLANLDRRRRDVVYKLPWPVSWTRVNDDRTAGARKLVPLVGSWLDDDVAARTTVLAKLFDGDKQRFDEAVGTADGWISREVEAAEFRDLASRGPGAHWTANGIRHAPIAPDPDRQQWPSV